MDKFVHLGFGGSDDLGIVVARVDNRDAGEAVEVLAAVDIGDGGAAGVVHDDGDYRLHEAGHYVVFVFLDGVRHESLLVFLCDTSVSFVVRISLQPQRTQRYTKEVILRTCANALLPSVRPLLSFRCRTRLASRPWPCMMPKKLSFQPLNGK